MRPPEDSPVVALFLELHEAPETERAGRLQALRREDPALASEVERLLAADASDGPLERLRDEVAQAAERRLLAEDAAHPPPERLGPWRLVERLGAGGMGVVWLAERAEGGFGQQVAIKIVRAGLASGEVVARFLVERQVLARLSHPAIARVIDGGQAPDGRPWFAMERVAGQPITTFARDRRLSLAERLRLMADVCDAVDLAHRSLVVHRDLKPSNILVTESGEPKLLDFGLAKLLEPAGDSLVTRTDVLALTPAYAAPEQILGGPITTATDVYALGALMCELLTGHLPHRREARTPAALADEVRAETITRPSALVRRGGRDPGAATAAQLDGDLDLIVLRALHADPARRYPGAAALAADLRCYLAGRPVAARPDSVGYRASRFARRHRLGVAAAALVAFSLCGGMLAALIQARRARDEAERARVAASRAERIKDFALALFREAAPTHNPAGRDMTAADLLERAAARVEEGLETDPLARAELRATVARGLLELGEAPAALPMLERSLAELRSLPGVDPLDLAIVLHDAAKGHRATGDLPRAEAAIREALALLERSPRDARLDRIRIRTTLGILANARGRHREAAEIGRLNLEERRTLLGADDPSLAVDWNNLAGTYLRINRFAEAEQAYREAQRLLLLDRESPEARLTWLKAGLAAALWGQGRLDEAGRLRVEALEIAGRTLGPDHHMVGNILVAQAIAATREGRPGDAIEPLDRARRILAQSGETARSEVELGAALALLSLDRDRDAEAVLDPLVRRLEARPSEVPARRWHAQALLGLARARLGRAEEGERLTRAAVEHLEGAGAGAADEYGESALRLAEVLARRGAADESRAWRARAHDALRRIYGAGHPMTRSAGAALEASPARPPQGSR